MEEKVENRSFDELLQVLSNFQRRKLLVALLEHNPQDDSPQVVGESTEEAGALTRMIQMHHVHLPKLEEYGFIVWNRETNEVSKGPEFEEIRPLLELLRDHEDELPDGWL